MTNRYYCTTPEFFAKDNDQQTRTHWKQAHLVTVRIDRNLEI